MEDSVRQEKPGAELDPETIKRRNELFQQYVAPYYNMVYKLTMQYSWSMENVEENYNEVLANFYRYIETYDPSRSIKTWLHIVTKRLVVELERKRFQYYQRVDHVPSNTMLRDEDDGVLVESDKPSSRMMDIDNYRDYYNDDILWVLDHMKPIHRDALIMQEAGYSLKEIADIEFEKGTLKSHNIETVKSRLYLARQYMKKHLTRDGKRKLDEEDDDGLYGDCDQD